MVDRSPAALLRPNPVSLTMEELASMEDLVEAGLLPKDFIDQHFDGLDAAVFGEDAPKDRKGQRQEQGLGSPRNQTSQSIEAYKRWCAPGRPSADPDYEANLARMQKELAATNERKRAEAASKSKTHKRRFVV